MQCGFRKAGTSEPRGGHAEGGPVGRAFRADPPCRSMRGKRGAWLVPAGEPGCASTRPRAAATPVGGWPAPQYNQHTRMALNLMDPSMLPRAYCAGLRRNRRFVPYALLSTVALHEQRTFRSTASAPFPRREGTGLSLRESTRQLAEASGARTYAKPTLHAMKWGECGWSEGPPDSTRTLR